MHLSALIKQKEYETIHYVLRRHWVTFVPQILVFIVLLLVPVALYFLFKGVTPGILTNDMAYPILVLFGSSYYLSIYLFFFAEFLTYYLDEWIITNDRIVDIEQLGLFSRSVSELDLFRIQDVTTDVHGAFATLFDYGNVSIKTASANLNIVAKNVPNPNKIRERLVQLAHTDRKYHLMQPGNNKSKDTQPS